MPVTHSLICTRAAIDVDGIPARLKVRQSPSGAEDTSPLAAQSMEPQTIGPSTLPVHIAFRGAFPGGLAGA